MDANGRLSYLTVGELATSGAPFRLRASASGLGDLASLSA
jgi:hypothetical protein